MTADEERAVRIAVAQERIIRAASVYVDAIVPEPDNPEDCELRAAIASLEEAKNWQSA